MSTAAPKIACRPLIEGGTVASRAITSGLGLAATATTTSAPAVANRHHPGAVITTTSTSASSATQLPFENMTSSAAPVSPTQAPPSSLARAVGAKISTPTASATGGSMYMAT